jgi:hydroxypyruvate isomerase
MPRFSANLSMLFQEVPFLERFEAAARAGFRGVEFTSPYAFPEAAIAERLERHGLTQALFNLPAGDWEKGDRGTACDPARVAEFQEGVDRALEYAKALGCPQVNCLAGIAPRGLEPERLRATFVSNLRYAARRLAEAGLDLAIEAINTRDMPGFYLCRSSQAFSILDEVGAPNLRFQYDVYHMQVMEGDLATTLERNVSRIGHVQIADNPGRHEPGTGEIAYDFLLPHLDRIGYRGWVGCEYRPAAGTVAGLGWLARWSGSTSSSAPGAR